MMDFSKGILYDVTKLVVKWPGPRTSKLVDLEVPKASPSEKARSKPIPESSKFMKIFLPEQQNMLREN